MAVKKGKEVAGKASSASTSYSAKRKKPLSSGPDDSHVGVGRSRKRRSGALQFVDDAAVDADDDDEDDDSDGLSYIDDLEGDDDEGLNGGLTDDIKPGEKFGKVSGKSQHLPLLLKEEDLSGDELEDFIRERYSKGSGHVTYGNSTKEAAERSSSFLSMKDPTIWRVRCMVGRERQIAFCLLQKFVDLHSMGTKLPVISVFALENVKGCVYVEAEKEADVIEACKGFCSLYTSRMTSVSKDEIPRLLSVKNMSSELLEGTWVRIKNGNYRGDLAQVVAFDEQRKRAMVKLIPRIDLQALAKKFGGGISLKQAGVPSPRLISSHELEDFRPHIQIKRDRLTGELFEILDGLMLKDGYLCKKVSTASLSYLGIQPSQNELMKFEAAKKDDENLNWLSLVYGGQKKSRLKELADDLETEKGSGYELHDLVLFGHKAFGVIIGMKGDGLQILKGDGEGPEIVTLQRKDIKSTCADKMFTASDHHKKTISISDGVRVLEGPLEGREGIVKHMYRGTLFIYDEIQTENCGFFCVKSQLCANIKKPKGSKNEKSDCSSSYVNMGESMELKESDSDSRRFRRMDSELPFSIGQTLRIRIGPLKGYLCRVLSMYRSNVTVKLDSLVKIITVDGKHLSEANVKNFGSTARESSFTQFGSQERPTDEGLPWEKSSWDLDLPSIARDSWHGCSISSAPFPSHSDNKPDNDQGADPWGSRLRSQDGKQPDQSKDLNCWDKEIGSSGGQSSAWNRASSDISCGTKDKASGWENKNSGDGGTSGNNEWHKLKPLTETGERNWGEDITKNGKEGDPSDNANDSWDRKAGSWSSTHVRNDQPSAWDVKGKSVSGNEADVSGKAAASWGKKEENDQPSAWDVKGKTVAGNKADDWDKAAVRLSMGKGVEQAGNWISLHVHNDQSSAWDVKGKSVSGNEADVWGKAASQSKKDGSDQPNIWDVKGKTSSGNKADVWGNGAATHSKNDNVDSSTLGRTSRGSNLNSSQVAHMEQSDMWDVKEKSVNGKELDVWSKAAASQSKKCTGDDNGGWGKVSGRSSWNNSISTGWKQDGGLDNAECRVQLTNEYEDQSNRWDKGTVPSCDQSDSWSKAKVKSTAGTSGGGAWANAEQWAPSGSVPGRQSNSWGKAKVSSGNHSNDWHKAKDGSEGETGGWSKSENPGRGQNDKWSKTELSGSNPASCWNRSAATSKETNGKGDHGDSWNGQRCSGRGRGYGRGRGRDRDDGSSGNRDQGNCWKKPTDFGGNHRSDWGRGGQNDGGSGNQRSSWNQLGDFDGNKGADWSGGKRDGSGGSEDQDGWNRSRDFSRRCGGYNWGGENMDNSIDARPFGHGRGGGRGQGRQQFSDWKNEQDSHGNSAFAGNSWGSDQPGGWGKSKCFDRNDGSGGNIDQGSSCDKWKSFGGETAGSDKSNQPKGFDNSKECVWNTITMSTKDGSVGLGQESDAKKNLHEAGKFTDWNRNNAAYSKDASGNHPGSFWDKGSGSANRETCNETDNWTKPKGLDSSKESGWNTGSASTKDAGAYQEQSGDTKKNHGGGWNRNVGALRDEPGNSSGSRWGKEPGLASGSGWQQDAWNQENLQATGSDGAMPMKADGSRDQLSPWERASSKQGKAKEGSSGWKGGW